MCHTKKNHSITLSPVSLTRYCLSLFLFLIFYHTTNAEYISLPLISSGFSWEASTDRINWIPAYPEYPNNLTIPYPATTDAEFMWYWNSANLKPTGLNGPNTVYFRSMFMLNDLHGMDAGAWIAVDDWMNLSVNGTSVATYQLELNFNNVQQPIPAFVDFTDLLNTRYQGDLTGYNTITIEAHDGGPVAYERAYEWLFFDAHNVNSTPILGSPSGMHDNGSGNGNGTTNPANVPEPGALLLLLSGLPALVIMRKGVKRRG